MDFCRNVKNNAIFCSRNFCRFCFTCLFFFAPSPFASATSFLLLLFIHISYQIGANFHGHHYLQHFEKKAAITSIQITCAVVCGASFFLIALQFAAIFFFEFLGGAFFGTFFFGHRKLRQILVIFFFFLYCSCKSLQNLKKIS